MQATYYKPENRAISTLRDPLKFLVQKNKLKVLIFLKKGSSFFLSYKDLIVMAMRTNNLKKFIGINNERVFEFVNSVFGQGMHLKRVESLANAALGLLHSEELPLPKGLIKSMQQNKWIAC